MTENTDIILEIFLFLSFYLFFILSILSDSVGCVCVWNVQLLARNEGWKLEG